MSPEFQGILCFEVRRGMLRSKCIKACGDLGAFGGMRRIEYVKLWTSSGFGRVNRILMRLGLWRSECVRER